jgi:hypothetical protein
MITLCSNNLEQKRLDMPFMSLSRLDLIDDQDLIPQETMDPYKPCWCGSGKKWKWCHKNREQQTPIPLVKLLSDMFAKAREGICLHPNAPDQCSDKIIRAHTVQRKGGLSKIAENSHVLSLKDGIPKTKSEEGITQPVLVGLRSASTFMGFCDRHDGAMFRPVEHGNVELNQETAFLLSFRAVAYEMFAKLAAERWSEVQRECDRGLSFNLQVRAQTIIHWTLLGTRKAIQDTSQWKAEYDKAYNEHNYSRFHYAAVMFDEILPFAVCGGVMPEFGFDGQKLQFLGRSIEEMEHIAFNVSVIEGRTVGVFGWLGEDNGFSRRFAESFLQLPEIEMADALLRFAFEHVENLFVKPSWWEAVPLQTRNGLLKRIKNGTMSADRTADCLMPEGNRLFDVLPVSIANHINA